MERRSPLPSGNTKPAQRRNNTPATASPCALPFTDVQTTDYFYVPVSYLYCRGVISGYGDNTFRPFSNTTRGQLSKIVSLARGCPNRPAP